jgi:hypothetical protein
MKRLVNGNAMVVLVKDMQCTEKYTNTKELETYFEELKRS